MRTADMPRARRLKSEGPVAPVPELGPQSTKEAEETMPVVARAGIKSVVVVDVNAGQAVYIDGVKVSGKERRRHMEDVCHSLKRGDVIELQHWHCAGCQMFEGQVREAGFPAKLSDLPEPRDEYVYPKP